MIKNLYRTVTTHRKQLAVCTDSKYGCSKMEYYEVISVHDISTEDNGYLVRNRRGYYDKLTIDEFDECLIIVDNCIATKVCAKSIAILTWLQHKHKILVSITPIIDSSGFNYSYEYRIKFPFIPFNIQCTNYDSYEIAFKSAINNIKKICLKEFGKTIDGWSKFFKT